MNLNDSMSLQKFVSKPQMTENETIKIMTTIETVKCLMEKGLTFQRCKEMARIEVHQSRHKKFIAILG